MEALSPVQARRVLVIASMLFLLLGLVPAARAIADSGKSEKAEKQRSEESATADGDSKHGKSKATATSDAETLSTNQDTSSATADGGGASVSDAGSKKSSTQSQDTDTQAAEPVITVDFSCTDVVVDSDKGLSNITVVYTDGTSEKTEFNGPEQYHWEFTAPAGKTIAYIMVKAGNPDAGEHSSDGERFDSDAVCEEPTDEPTDAPTDVPTEEPTEPVDEPVIIVEFTCTDVVVDSDKGLSNITVVYTDGTSEKIEFNGPEQYHWEFTAPEGKTIAYIMVKAGNPDAGEHPSDGELFDSDAVCEEPTDFPTDFPTDGPTEGPTEGPDGNSDIDDEEGDKDPDNEPRPTPPDPKDPDNPDDGGGIGPEDGPNAPDEELPATGAPLVPLSAVALGSLALGGVMLRRSRRPAALIAEESAVPSIDDDIAPTAEQPVVSPITGSTGTSVVKLAGLGVLAVVGVALIIRARRSR